MTAGPVERIGAGRGASPLDRTAAISPVHRPDAGSPEDHHQRRFASQRISVTIDDRALLGQMRAGDASAFAVLFERYYDALCAFAGGYAASEAEAEEIVEDVFVRVWELRERLEVRESLKTYLYTATRNRALNRLRDDRVRLRRIAEAAEDAAPPGMGQPMPAVDEELHAAEFARAVERAVAHLPERTRQVFLMHRQHGLSYAEIGAVLEISPKTVENLIGRALRELRARLAHFLST